MYHVDERDRVVAWKEVPQSDVGAPMPIIVANEHTVAVAFYVQELPQEWNERLAHAIVPSPFAIAHFKGRLCHFHGPPNDEVYGGHPLASRGLTPYGAFEVLESSWIREMERRNSVHPRHRGGWLTAFKHWILTFHDTTFECIAANCQITAFRGSQPLVVNQMIEMVLGPDFSPP